jgi:hypothetical protein
MKTTCSFETSVDSQRMTLCYIPEDTTLLNHRCEKLLSYTVCKLARNILDCGLTETETGVSSGKQASGM